MRVSAMLLLCLFIVWTSTSIGLNNVKAHKLHMNPQYPAQVCTTFHSYEGQSHQVLDGAHNAHLHQPRGTGGYQFRKCQLVTKSTDIENYNFLARYTNGNGRGSGLKLYHWNKGGSYLINSINVIEQVIDQYRPHILGISVCNFYSNHNLEDVQIDNYNLFLADTLNNPNLNVSRVAVYAQKDIVVSES